MNTVLVPVELLEMHLPELGRRAQSLSLAPEMLLRPHGEALLFSLLFERWPNLVGELSLEARFYNRYFWFLRFVVLHTETHGPDAGLEQQALQILESAEFEIDSEILGRIETEAAAASAKELPEPLFAELTARTNLGQGLFDQCRFSEALPAFQSAWELLPLPKEQWNAALWILAAIGDCHFLMRDFSAARHLFLDAMALPGAVGNAFLHLRLGEIALELGDESRAADELIRAYAVGGREAFAGEDPKYLEFLATKSDLLDS